VLYAPFYPAMKTVMCAVAFHLGSLPKFRQDEKYEQ
jgi:hypothetical protein